MSLDETIKGLTLKKPSADQRHSTKAMADDQGENENPYLAARRTWNDRTSSIVSSRNMWQLLGILSLMIALAGVGGIIYIGSQSRFVPYVVEVDKLGQAAAVAPAQLAAAVDPRVVHAAVASFISDARLVTPDVALQRKATSGVTRRKSLMNDATAACTTRGSTAAASWAGATAAACPNLSTSTT